MAKLVFGVGVNDANYVVKPVLKGVRVCCPFYRTWFSMLRRCYSSHALKRNPTYDGCGTVSEWLTFMTFRNWMGGQDWKGKELDKDLLGGGKLYGPCTCLFVSQSINKFMNSHDATRGAYPIGVHRRRRRFLAQIVVEGKKKHLGCFDTPEEAHLAWAQAKAKQAFIYATEQTDQRIADALRSFGEGLLWAEY